MSVKTFCPITRNGASKQRITSTFSADLKNSRRGFGSVIRSYPRSFSVPGIPKFCTGGRPTDPSCAEGAPVFIFSTCRVIRIGNPQGKQKCVRNKIRDRRQAENCAPLELRILLSVVIALDSQGDQPADTHE